MAEYSRVGGIRGLSRQSAAQVSTSSEGEEGEEGSATFGHTSKQQSSYNESNKFPFPLWAPGYVVFSHTPNLMTRLYPPEARDCEARDGLLNPNVLQQQQNPEMLSQLISQRWFLLEYRLKPCPTVIWKWLFQVMCFSCDKQLAERASMCLKTLVEWACEKTQVYVPSLATVLNVLVELGAEREVLEGRTPGQAQVPPAAAEQNDDVFQVSPPVSNLTNLFRYLTHAVASCPIALSPEDVCRLIPILAIVSLDSALTRHPHLISAISECLSSLVSTFPSAVWSEITLPLAKQLVQCASHHHNLLHLSKLLLPATPPMTQLQRAICRVSIWKILFPETPLEELSDYMFASIVVKYYRDMPAAQFDYYIMYSVVCLLSQLLHLSPPEWPSTEKKKEFKSMLSVLASVNIKDSADRPERGLVKDLLISLSLEMHTQRTMDTLQSDLFSYIGN